MTGVTSYQKGSDKRFLTLEWTLTDARTSEQLLRLNTQTQVIVKHEYSYLRKGIELAVESLFDYVDRSGKPAKRR